MTIKSSLDDYKIIYNMLTKTQGKIMQFFTGRITDSFAIREVERNLQIDYSLVHRAIQPLIKGQFLKVEKGGLMLNFRKNHSTLAYVESLRRDELLHRPKYTDLVMCLHTFIKKFKEENFALLLFGSMVYKKDPSDFDLLLIVDNEDKIESSEAFLHNISRDYELEEKLHIVCISYEMVYDMLGSREQKNVINEVLNKHIIVHGAELFYRLLDRGRKIGRAHV